MIYVLSKDNIPLAAQEVLVLVCPLSYSLYENILVCDGVCDYGRLAYTSMVLETVFVSDTIQSVDWEKYYGGDFCVRSNVTGREKELAAIIWRSVKNPKVKLRGSSSEFWFFFAAGKVICGKAVFTRIEKFHLRRPDLRPGFFPVSVKPKLARALVNLTGVQKGTLWDPFCGTGGILIEAALLGIDIVGTDIDPEMIRACKKNFDHYRVQGVACVGDARQEVVECDAIVTDPPYGRRASLKKVDIENLYNEFLAHVYPFVSTVVIMCPNNLRITTDYRTVFEGKDFVHNSLTRRILVLHKGN